MLFVSCESYPNTKTLIPDNLNVTDNTGTSLNVQNVMFSPADRLISIEVSGGVPASLCLVSSNNIPDINGLEINLSEETYLVSEYPSSLYETSVRSVQLIKDGVPALYAGDSGEYEVLITLYDNGNEVDKTLSIISSGGEVLADNISVGTNKVITREVFLSYGETVYVTFND